jgi:hypothetical protein
LILCERICTVRPPTVTDRSFHTVGHTNTPSTITRMAAGMASRMNQKVRPESSRVQSRRDGFRPRHTKAKWTRSLLHLTGSAHYVVDSATQFWYNAVVTSPRGHGCSTATGGWGNPLPLLPRDGHVRGAGLAAYRHGVVASERIPREKTSFEGLNRPGMAAQSRMRRRGKHRNEGHPRNGFPGSEPLVDVVNARRALVLSDILNKTLSIKGSRHHRTGAACLSHEPKLHGQNRLTAGETVCHRGGRATTSQPQVILETFAIPSPAVN